MIVNVEKWGRFELDSNFLNTYRDKPVKWGFGDLSWATFKRTYSRDGEDWWQTCRRVIEGMFTIQKVHCMERGLPWNDEKARRFAQKAYDRLFDFKWTPPGRGLWMMGTDYIYERGGAALNNCFRGDTEFIDGNGTVRSLEEAYHEGSVKALTAEGNMIRAKVEKFGEQALTRVVVKPKGLRTNVRLTYDVTADHRWELDDGSQTTKLSVGDDIRSPVAPDVEMDLDGFAHGMMYADGTSRTNTETTYQVRLCRSKNACLERLRQSSLYKNDYEPESMDGDIMVVMSDAIDLKAVPESTASASYIKGFIEGWKYGDGTHDDGVSFSIDTQDEEAARWLKRHAWIAGYAWTGVCEDDRPTNFGERSAPLQRIKLSRRPYAYRVVEIQDLEEKDTVYCLQVPKDHSFMLAGGVPTGNCGFISTENIDRDYAEPYVWMFGMSMLGVGVGFDTRGAGSIEVRTPERVEETHVIGDSREGWAEALRRLLNAFVGRDTLPSKWDYSEIRPKGAPIRSFGGVASGPGPLKKMLEELETLYESYVGSEVDSELIVDTMNMAGRCVVSGGVRRTAQISFGEPEDEQFLDLKMDPEKVREYRWASNNSVFARVGMDYEQVAERTGNNGEPGYLWLENARAYGRMKDDANWKDEHAKGSNPCVEQTLWDKELCTLVETYPAHHEDLEDYKETLRVAYQYAKTVTLIPTHDSGTNAVMLRNRRIGCSMTGIVQALNRHGYREFFDWCDQGYGYIQTLDRKYSDWLCVPRSIKTTSVKPSGTVSLLAGATPGVHWDHSPHYIRRIRVREGHPLVAMCEEAGYSVEPDTYADETTVISFPVRVEGMERKKDEVSLHEKMDLAAQIQKYWADNQVSCTAEFDPDTEADEIPRLLAAYEDRLKGISFLPTSDHGYEQAPYETISKERYDKMKAKIKPLRGRHEGRLEHDQEDKFCDGDACKIE